MRIGPALAVTAIAFAAVMQPAGEALAAKIGLALPLSGPLRLLGEQAKAGAELAAAQNGDTLSIADDACTPESGAALAARFVAEKVSVAAGFVCLESLNAALPALKDAAIPAITIGVRANALTDTRQKSGFLVTRLAPRDDMEGKALAAFLLPLWAKSNFAIIDDGTIHARDIAEEFRAAATEAGLKPVFVDTYRPGLSNQAALARRLRKAGAVNVMIGGDIDDALVLSRDAVAYGGLSVAMGETGLPSDPLAPHGPLTTLALPDYTLAVPAAETNRALIAAGKVPDNYALLAHAAIEIAHQALGKATPVRIGTGPYPTAIGVVQFNAAGDLAANPYVLRNLGAIAAPADAGGQ